MAALQGRRYRVPRYHLAKARAQGSPRPSEKKRRCAPPSFKDQFLSTMSHEFAHSAQRSPGAFQTCSPDERLWHAERPPATLRHPHTYRRNSPAQADHRHPGPFPRFEAGRMEIVHERCQHRHSAFGGSAQRPPTAGGQENRRHWSSRLSRPFYGPRPTRLDSSKSSMNLGRQWRSSFTPETGRIEIGRAVGWGDKSRLEGA